MISVCTKICSRCKEEKPTSEFGKRSSRPDGLQYFCKPCSRLAVKEIRYRDIELTRRKEAEYIKANKQASLKRQRRWREANRDKARNNTRRWRLENPEKARYLRHVRRAMEMNAPTFLITKKDMAALLSRPCVYCGGPNQHIDHVIPLARGGRNSIGNLVSSCAKCNQAKGASFVMQWKMRMKCFQ
jgi:5-methylcytosine-specific restriction endonuclease McrA